MPTPVSVSSPSRLRPILIVDDSDDDMDLLRRTLNSAGTANPIIAFESGIDAKNYLQHALTSREERMLPCLVFTDLKMPGMTGIELIAWARANPLLNPVGFIILSTSPFERDRDASHSAGADRYLVKFPEADIFTDIVAVANANPRLLRQPAPESGRK
jgi:CheY-like chemotaxis protein